MSQHIDVRPSMTEVNELNNKIIPNAAYTGDLNNAPEGVVYTGSGVTNTPANYAYWFVITTKQAGNGQIGSQIAIGRTGDNPPMYYRVKSGGTWTSWNELALNSKTTLEYLLSNPTVIPSNSDLNTFLTPGVYYVSSSNAAASLLNCPETGAFEMIVLSRANAVSQIIFGANKIYKRHGTTSGITGNGWYVFTGTQVT